MVKELHYFGDPVVCPSFARARSEGALGVGGASDEQDVECALAGIDAIVGEGDNSGQYQPR